MNKEEPGGLEFFDVDHTITRSSTAISYLMLLVRNKLIPATILMSVPYAYLNYKYGKMDEKHFNRKIPEFIGIEKKLLEKISVENFERYIKKSIYPGAENYIRKLKDSGKSIIFASSSMEIILRPLLEYLGADDLIATRVDFRDGVCTGSFVDTPVFKTEKRRKVIEYIKNRNVTLENSSFYSDSIHDLPLLEEVGRPVAANPDIRLRIVAKRRGWEIMDFKKL